MSFSCFFSTALWITGAIPPFALSLFILAYLVFTFGNPHLNSAPEKIDRYVNAFSSSIIWLDHALSSSIPGPLLVVLWALLTRG
jgi:hypothetical protein